MSDKTEVALKAVTDALGSHGKWFDVTAGEILVDDDEYFSIMVCLTPKKVDHSDFKVIAGPDYIQIDVDDEDDCTLITGEDTENEVSLAMIYCQLYWGEATEGL